LEKSIDLSFMAIMKATKPTKAIPECVLTRVLREPTDTFSDDDYVFNKIVECAMSLREKLYAYVVLKGNPQGNKVRGRPDLLF
jgi:hypothetical protein